MRGLRPDERWLAQWRRAWGKTAWRKMGRRGAAAVELALAFPVLALVFGNVVDYGLMLRQRAQLATGLSNAAQYATLTGSGVTTAMMQSITTASSWLTGATASASNSACYCPSGFPVTLGSAVSCTSTCGGGGAPAKYVTITANYTYTPFFPDLSGLTSRTITQTVTVMVR